MLLSVGSPVEASTMHMFEGRHWRKSSQRKAESVDVALSPSSCYIRQSSCEDDVALKQPSSGSTTA